MFAGPASTTSRTWTLRSHATPWWSSPACRDRESRRWPSGRSTRRRSGGIWNRSLPMRGACFTRWACPRSTKSTVSRRRSRCSSSADHRPHVRRSAASRRSRICCGCSTRGPGTYPRGQAHLDAEAFSTNTPAGACPECHGLGRVYQVTEASMVPDPSKTIRERAIAAWPPAWHGQNLSGHARVHWGTTSTRPGAISRRRTASGSCSPRSSRRFRSTPATRRPKPGAPSSERRSRATRVTSRARVVT